MITAGSLAYADSQTGGFEGGAIGHGKMDMTDAEITKLTTMTVAEKQAYVKAKMAEKKALHDTKELVIDTLINGETLNDAEKTTPGHYQDRPKIPPEIRSGGILLYSRQKNLLYS